MVVEKLYGLVGHPLSHSFSKKYFTEKFLYENIEGAVYKNFEIKEIHELKNIVLTHPNLIGFSVTIPHKESILPYLDEVDPNAEEVGAVNAVKIIKSGNNIRLKGFNTDFYGFLVSLKEYLKGDEKMALILGNGGAAKAVAHALKQINIAHFIVSRNVDCTKEKFINYKQLTEKLIGETDIIVNTTPLGMWPDTQNAVDIPYQAIKPGAIAYDLIYNPAETLFMKKSRANGAVVVNGLKMLELQAEKAWEIFNSHE